MGALALGGVSYGFAYDSADGVVYAMTSGVGIASVDSFDRVTTDVVPSLAGQVIYQGAYDNQSAELFFPEYEHDCVVVVNATSGAIVATLGAGSGPIAIAFDPENGNVYVANIGGHNLTVINGQRNVVSGSLGGVWHPVSIAVDDRTGDLWVANFGGSNISVLNGSNGRSVGVVDLLAYDLAYDPENGWIYVNDGSGTAYIVNGSSRAFVSGVNLATGSQSATSSISVDEAAGSAAVTDSESDNVTLFNVSTARLVGSAVAGNSSSDSIYDPANRCLYVANAASPYLTVLALPLRTSLFASRQTAPAGVPVTFAVRSHDGIPPLAQFSWMFGDGNSTSTATNSTAHAYSAAGNYTATVVVTDAGGYSSTATVQLQVSPRPAASTPAGSVRSADVGQSVVFRSVGSGGLPPYSYSWSGLPPGCSGLGTGTVRCTISSPSTYSITVIVTDATNTSSAPSSPLGFTAFADPTVSAPAANRSSTDVGQALAFSAGAAFGSGGYVYTWSGLPEGCPSGPPPVRCHPVTPSVYSVRVQVLDSNNESSLTSAPLNLTVFPDPTVNLSTNHAILDVGMTLRLSAGGQAGSGGLRYRWSGLPAGCDGSSANLTCRPTLPAVSHVSVEVTDSNDAEAISQVISMTVNPTLSSGPPILSSAAVAGDPVTLVARSSGGSPPVTLAWSLGDGARAVGTSVNHTYAAGGTYHVILWVNDSAGGAVVRTLDLRVSAPLGPTSLSWSGWALLTGGPLVIALVVVLAWRRRRATRAPGDLPRGPGGADESGELQPSGSEEEWGEPRIDEAEVPPSDVQ